MVKVVQRGCGREGIGAVLSEVSATSFHEALSRWGVINRKMLSQGILHMLVSWNPDICKAVTQITRGHDLFGTVTFEIWIVIGFVHKLFTAVVVSLAGRAGAWEPRKLVSRLIPKRPRTFPAKMACAEPTQIEAQTVSGLPRSCPEEIPY